MTSRPRIAAAICLLATALVLGLRPAPEASAAGPCQAADALPGQGSYAQLGRATLCLVNHERRRRGLRGLRAERRLALAARRHAEDMVRNSYFAHNSLTGADFLSRIAKAGYLARARLWVAGENLAWGAGGSATPREIVRSWMNSPPHRVNVLGARFRDLGVAVVRGAPVRAPYQAAATYVHEFGSRR